jgi:hypothetical protein
MVRIGYAGKPVSQATISKLSKAMSDPTKTKYGVTLGGRAGDCIAPDGGACADYYKGWRYLPNNATPEEKEILKKNSKVAYALIRLSELTGAGRESDATGSQSDHHKTVNDAYYNLVIAPQIKAEEERKAREEEEQRQLEINQAVQLALTQKVRETSFPTPEPTPAVTSSLPIIPIIIIAVIVGIFLLKRRA